ncbi:hypothetical protein RhiJN_27238 [Ceratobasidium sp. AG-Ba]|nr:hypothetical protein RhiJN_27238 [Ceratobasidium sp. AG-Ba]
MAGRVETRDLSELEERTHYPSSSREYPPSLCRDYPPSSLRDYPRPTRDVPPSQTQPRRLRIASPAPDDVYKFPQPTMSPYALASALVPVPVLVYVRGRSSTVSTSHWPLQTSSPPLATPRPADYPSRPPFSPRSKNSGHRPLPAFSASMRFPTLCLTLEAPDD